MQLTALPKPQPFWADGIDPRTVLPIWPQTCFQLCGSRAEISLELSDEISSVWEQGELSARPEIVVLIKLELFRRCEKLQKSQTRVAMVTARVLSPRISAEFLRGTCQGAIWRSGPTEASFFFFLLFFFWGGGGGGGEVEGGGEGG